MEEIRKVAQVYYKAMPKKSRKLAKEFFKKMDDNGDGKKLIVGMHFTCVKCSSCDPKSFCLHPTCFGRGKYVHKHSDFLVNYALLKSIRHNGLPGGDAQKNQV
ncbi:hypothetical protein ACSBR1_008231 [Camellia fascicularis]